MNASMMPVPITKPKEFLLSTRYWSSITNAPIFVVICINATYDMIIRYNNVKILYCAFVKYITNPIIKAAIGITNILVSPTGETLKNADATNNEKKIIKRNIANLLKT